MVTVRLTLCLFAAGAPEVVAEIVIAVARAAAHLGRFTVQHRDDVVIHHALTTYAVIVDIIAQAGFAQTLQTGNMNPFSPSGMGVMSPGDVRAQLNASGAAPALTCSPMQTWSR